MKILGIILQVLLALVFTMSGFMKLVTSKADLLQDPRGQWVENFHPMILKLIGLLEILGVLGLLLPLVTSLPKKLTGFAAIGLMCTMVGAMITHLSRGEGNVIIMNIVLFSIAGVIAYLNLKVPDK